MYNSSSGAFSLTYTPQTAGVEIVSIEVDNNVSYRANDNQGKVTATISNLGYGSHSLTYYFQTPGNSSVPFTSSRKLERAGTLTIQMKLSVENGLVVATLTDQNGEPVVDYPVDLYLSGVKQRSQQSDSSGRVTFNVAAPDDRSTVRCVAPSRKIGSVSYVGCEEYLATPTTTRPTDGTTAGRPTTTGKTNGSTTGFLHGFRNHYHRYSIYAISYGYGGGNHSHRRWLYCRQHHLRYGDCQRFRSQ